MLNYKDFYSKYIIKRLWSNRYAKDKAENQYWTAVIFRASNMVHYKHAAVEITA